MKKILLISLLSLIVLSFGMISSGASSGFVYRQGTSFISTVTPIILPVAIAMIYLRMATVPTTARRIILKITL